VADRGTLQNLHIAGPPLWYIFATCGSVRRAVRLLGACNGSRKTASRVAVGRTAASHDVGADTQLACQDDLEYSQDAIL